MTHSSIFLPFWSCALLHTISTDYLMPNTATWPSILPLSLSFVAICSVGHHTAVVPLWFPPLYQHLEIIHTPVVLTLYLFVAVADPSSDLTRGVFMCRMHLAQLLFGEPRKRYNWVRLLNWSDPARNAPLFGRFLAFFEALFAVNFFRFRTTATIILLSKHMTLLKITVTSLLSLIFDLFSNLSNSPHSHADFKVL